MLDNATRVIEYTQEKTESEFLEDIILQDAVCRRLAILGEAAYELYTKIDPSVLEMLPEIEWKQIGNLRHFLIHHYNDINMDRVWKTIIEDIPPLITKLESAINQ
jgi:uncharacterized protein with HEPN domain